MTAPNSPYLSGYSRYASPAEPGTPPAAAEAPRVTVAAIEARVRRYNADIDPRSATFRAAVMLLVAIEYGQNIDTLARRTGFERSFIAKCARRLIDNGVWVSGETVSDWSPDDEASGAFWNDVAVAEGKLCRRLNSEGAIEWAPAGYWSKSYEFIDAASERRVSTVYRDRASLPAPDAAAPRAAESTAADSASDAPSDEPTPHGSALPPTPTAADAEPAPPTIQPRRPAAPAPSGELFPDVVWLR